MHRRETLFPAVLHFRATEPDHESFLLSLVPLGVFLHLSRTLSSKLELFLLGSQILSAGKGIKNEYRKVLTLREKYHKNITSLVVMPKN